jgi:hypothetical protein
MNKRYGPIYFEPTNQTTNQPTNQIGVPSTHKNHSNLT